MRGVFLLNEAANTTRELLTHFQCEEAMLLADYQNAVASNFPAPAVLIAGLLSPIFLTIALWVKILELSIMHIPVIILCIWAIYTDHVEGNTVCSIPTIKYWVWSQLVLAVILMLANLVQVIQIFIGKRSIRMKGEEMQENLKRLEEMDHNNLSFSDIR